MSQKTVVHFNGLNSLRFIAASMILVFHCVGGPLMTSPFEGFLHNLPAGVDFFFIISGFLITYLLLQEKDLNHSISIGAFYIRRILRIFPLYYFIILLSFVAFFHSDMHINYTPQLYFWGNFESIKEHQWIGGWLTPLWSLCVEEHFYWVIPFLIALLPVKSIKYLYAIIIIISIVSKAYYATNDPWNWLIINCHTFSKMDVIALGGLLACIHFEHPISLNSSPVYCLIPLLIVILMMCFVDFSNYTTVVRATFIRYLLNIPFIIFFMLYILNDHPAIARIKSNATMNYLGSISYGIYMYHSIATYYTGKWIPPNSLLLKILLVITVAAISIGMAALSYKYFEMPFLRLKKRFERVKT